MFSFKNKTKKSLLLIFTAYVSFSYVYSSGKKDTPYKTPSASTTFVSDENLLDSYPLRFREITKATDALIKQNNYKDAIKEFYKDEKNNNSAFTYLKPGWEQNADEEEIKKVSVLLQKLDITLNEYKQIQDDLKILSTQNNLYKDTDKLKKSFMPLAEVINRIEQIIQGFTEIKSTPYTQSVLLFLKGAPESQTSGVRGVIKAQWNTLTKNIINSYGTDYDEPVGTLIECLSKEKIFEKNYKLKANRAIDALKEKLTAAKNVLQLNALLNVNSLQEESLIISYEKLFKDTEKLFLIAENIDEKKTIAQSSNLKEPDDIFKAFSTSQTDFIEHVTSIADFFTETGRECGALKTSEHLEIIQKNTHLQLFSRELEKAFLSACQTLETESSKEGIKYWTEASRYYAKASELTKNYIEDELQRTKSYLIPDREGNTYPSRAIKKADELTDEILNYETKFKESKTDLNRGFIYRANFIKEINTIDESSKSLEDFRHELIAVKEDAKNSQIIAKASANEIERFLKLAEDNIKKENFVLVHENITNVSNVFNSRSDSLKHDADILNECFQKFQTVKTNAINKERPIIIRTLREKKDRARLEYYAGRFEEASAILTFCENTLADWARLLDSEIENDGELERLKNYVNTALMIKEGRDFSPFDAKAQEMEQQLSFASEAYKNGEKLLKGNKKEEALEQLEKAYKLLNQIKIYYPKNSQTTILQFKILKITKGSSYSEIIREKVSELSKLNFKEKSPQAQEAYAELEDILTLEPDYPGLKQALLQIERDLGLKPAPVTSDNYAKSQKLSQEAGMILSSAGSNSAELLRAKEKAEEALALNAENAEAKNILDSIAKANFSQVNQLSPEDEKLYQEAILDMQNNRLLSAKEKVNKLLSKEDNKKSSKVIRLQKRIEALL